MTKNNRNHLIAVALFVAILSPLYAFSVVGLPVVAAAALIFTGLFIFDWFRTKKATSKPGASVLDANLQVPPSPSLAVEKDLIIKPQVNPAVTPAVTPALKSPPIVQTPQVKQPDPVTPAAVVPTYAELTNKLSALQKSMEEGRHMMMQFTILQALKLQGRRGKLNPDFIDEFVSSIKYNAFMRRTERESDTLVFLQNELGRIQSENVKEAELLAIFNFYQGILEFEKKLKPIIEQYQDLIKGSQISPDAFSKVASYLPMGVNIMSEFAAQKRELYVPLLENDVNTLVQMREIDLKTWLIEQGKQSAEIQGLVIRLMEQEKALVSPFTPAKPLSP